MPFWKKHSSSFEGNTATLDSDLWHYEPSLCNYVTKLLFLYWKCSITFVRAFTLEAASKATQHHLILKNICKLVTCGTMNHCRETVLKVIFSFIKLFNMYSDMEWSRIVRIWNLKTKRKLGPKLKQEVFSTWFL